MVDGDVARCVKLGPKPTPVKFLTRNCNGGGWQLFVCVDCWEICLDSGNADNGEFLGSPDTHLDSLAIELLSGSVLIAWWMLQKHRSISARESLKIAEHGNLMILGTTGAFVGFRRPFLVEM